jgi:cell division protein FtsN
MIDKRNIWVLCCAAMLLLSGCSRQQSDWQKTREANTADAYEQFLKKYPSGEFTAQAQARVKELYEERDWQKARDADTPEAYQAFLKQYPEGKWTEEARIRVENFTLAQAPASGPPGAGDTAAASSAAASGNTAPGNTASATVAPAANTAPTSKAKSPTPARRSDTSAETGSSGAAATPGGANHSRPRTAAAAGGSGHYGIQLGAFKSGPAAAHARWAHLRKLYPAQLSGLSSKVAKKTTEAGTLYRLQVANLSEKHARALCRHLTAKSEPCVVLTPHD